MIQEKATGYESLKQIREREKKEVEAKQRKQCEAFATEKYGEQLVQWSNANGGVWYMPTFDEAGEITHLAIMKPVNRHILSHASTKLEDDGLYTFLEVCMRECLLNDDDCGLYIVDNEEAFISGSMKFNKMLEGKKVAFLKR